MAEGVAAGGGGGSGGIGGKWKLSTGIEMKVQIGKWQQQRQRVE